MIMWTFKSASLRVIAIMYFNETYISSLITFKEKIINLGLRTSENSPGLIRLDIF